MDGGLTRLFHFPGLLGRPLEDIPALEVVERPFKLYILRLLELGFFLHYLYLIFRVLVQCILYLPFGLKMPFEVFLLGVPFGRLSHHYVWLYAGGLYGPARRGVVLGRGKPYGRAV